MEKPEPEEAEKQSDGEIFPGEIPPHFQSKYNILFVKKIINIGVGEKVVPQPFLVSGMDEDRQEVELVGEKGIIKLKCDELDFILRYLPLVGKKVRVILGAGTAGFTLELPLTFEGFTIRPPRLVFEDEENSEKATGSQRPKIPGFP